MDHAKRIEVANGTVELGPARWKVLLAIPAVGFSVWFTIACLFSF